MGRGNLLCRSLLTATFLSIGLPGGPGAQELGDQPPAQAAQQLIGLDLWLVSTDSPVTLFSEAGDVLGAAEMGARFKPLLEDDGWILVYPEDNPDLLFWIERGAVIEVGANALPSATGPQNELEAIEEIRATPAAVSPTLVPTNTPLVTPTTTLGPTQTAAASPTANPTATEISAPTATATDPPGATATPLAPTATAAPSPSATIPMATDLPAPTLMSTPTPTATTTILPTTTRTPTTTATLAPASGSVNIQDFLFSPGSVTIRVGGTVTWTNRGSAPHTATSTSGPGSFNTGTLTSGQSSSKTLSVAGTYSYRCDIHQSMTAMVIVQ